MPRFPKKQQKTAIIAFQSTSDSDFLSPFKIPILANRLANWRLFCCNYSFPSGSLNFALKLCLSTVLKPSYNASYNTIYIFCFRTHCLQNKTFEKSHTKPCTKDRLSRKIRLLSDNTCTISWYNVCTFLDIKRDYFIYYNPFSKKNVNCIKDFVSKRRTLWPHSLILLLLSVDRFEPEASILWPRKL